MWSMTVHVGGGGDIIIHQSIGSIYYPLFQIKLEQTCGAALRDGLGLLRNGGVVVPRQQRQLPSDARRRRRRKQRLQLRVRRHRCAVRTSGVECED